jgi:hypothetical protein
MAGLTARVMAVSILTGRVYTRNMRREETLKEKIGRIVSRRAKSLSGGECNE